MLRIGVRELRQNASRYLALVKRGQTVEVTERGQLVAVLTPPGGGSTTRERLVAEGRLLPASDRSGRVRAPQPVDVGVGEPTNQELLEAGRDESL